MPSRSDLKLRNLPEHVCRIVYAPSFHSLKDFDFSLQKPLCPVGTMGVAKKLEELLQRSAEEVPQGSDPVVADRAGTHRRTLALLQPPVEQCQLLRRELQRWRGVHAPAEKGLVDPVTPTCATTTSAVRRRRTPPTRPAACQARAIHRRKGGKQQIAN
jgi:hypothetical protein